jgi:hypothetical protein
MLIAANARALGKSIICGKATVVVLIVRIEVLGREVLQVPPRCSNLCDDLLSRDRVPRVEVEDVSCCGRTWPRFYGFRARASTWALIAGQ